jgi:L-fuconate dehydratase
VQHLSVVDYVAVSGSLEGRMIEYVDHLHEHFLDPVVIDRGRYRVPSRPGYSAQMRAGSLERYAFPEGAEWRLGGSSGGGRAARPLSESVSGSAAPG